jgi:hypothetical protein
MSCEEAWKRSWELARELNRAHEEELALRPYGELGQAIRMTGAEMDALAEAQEKHAAVARAYYEATAEALRLNRLHFP